MIESNKDKLTSFEYNKMKFKAINAADDIKKYHAHLLVAQNQNKFWSNLSDDSGKTAQMISDFPQQKLPEWNQQTQEQYFGNAAMANWHMTQIKKKLPSGFKEVQSFPTIYDRKTHQDTYLVVPTMESNLLLYSKANENVKYIDLKTDNASCYTNETFYKSIMEMNEKMPIKIQRIIHNAPGDGKDSAGKYCIYFLVEAGNVIYVSQKKLIILLVDIKIQK